ncbi:MAG: polysaccharide deacetylase family protein [Acidimicrobiales bacterium]
MKTTVLTIDVEGDWGGSSTRGVDEVLPRLVTRLGRAGVAATFFVVGDLIDAVAPHLRGTDHEVGSHSMTHRRLGGLDDHQQRWEMTASRAAIEAAGFDVRGFRAPYLAPTEATGSQLAEAGYCYDASAGRLHPFRRSAGAGTGAAVSVGSLRGGLPFTFTWLRMIGARSRHLLPDRGVVLCHLHDFLDRGHGWSALPSPVRRVHARNSGAPAWVLLDGMLDDPARRFTTAGALV